MLFYKNSYLLFELFPELIMKKSPLALIAAVSFCGGVHHKRYKWIAGNSS